MLRAFTYRNTSRVVALPSAGKPRMSMSALDSKCEALVKSMLRVALSLENHRFPTAPGGAGTLLSSTSMH